MLPTEKLHHDYGDRLRTARMSMAVIGVDAMLVTDEVNVRYLTGFTGDSTALLLSDSDATLISDGRYTTQIRDQCGAIGAFIRPPAMPMHAAVIESLAGFAGRIGIESTAMNVDQWTKLGEAFAKGDPPAAVTIVPVQRWIGAARSCKDAVEVEAIGRAVEVAQAALVEVMGRLDRSWTERELAWQLEGAMRDRGASGASFPIIAAAGPAAALPHYHPGQNVIGDHPHLLIDWGASVDGYVSDLTRTLWIGDGEMDPEWLRCHRSVDRAVKAGIAAIRPGASVADVDAAARSVLKEAELDQYFLHSLGHGIGLEVHESPRLAATPADVTPECLRPGMVVTIEPGVYFADRFGIRLEEDVLVTDSGAEVLSNLGRGPGLVDLTAIG